MSKRSSCMSKGRILQRKYLSFETTGPMTNSAVTRVQPEHPAAAKRDFVPPFFLSAYKRLLGSYLEYLSPNNNIPANYPITPLFHLWGAHIWTQFRHKEHHRKSPVLQRHGSRIRHLSCDYLDKDTVKSVTQFCQSVQSLYLHLNLNAFWAHYDVLEGMFITLRDRLTKVHIRFDASVISPMLLWSLSQLPHLTDLHLDPYHSQYFEGKYRPLEEYLSLLRICIGLQSLTVGGCFLDTARPFVHSGTKEAIPRWMKKILRPKGDPTVVADFPCLESLELIDFYFDKDPDLVALDAHLHALEKQQRGKTHPLRRLYFTGAMDQPVKMLLDALAFSSLSIEYLAVGKTSIKLNALAASGHLALLLHTFEPSI
ncbi:hypothetical protein BGX24_005004 [Mortierella sp. AD032]|nr:hypothetical protein BGX24_005004 [Mortierella sp. AD032]